MIRTDRPTLELLPSRRPLTGLWPVLHALTRFADLHASDPALTRPQARLATSTASVGLRHALRDDVPLAVALAAGEEPPAEIAERAEVLLAPRLPGAPDGDASSGWVTWPVPSIDTAGHPPLTPFVRERWRARLALPATIVVVEGFEPAAALAPAAIPSALALCSAAAVRGPHALLALALGTPLVTDATEAARLGATDGHDLIVAPASDAAAAARELADDPLRAVRVGWGARLLAERLHDARPAAHLIAGRLGLLDRQYPGDALQARLDELGTPLGAPPAARALERCEPFLSLAGARGFAS